VMEEPRAVRSNWVQSLYQRRLRADPSAGADRG
jgi:hypothetical protein